MDLVFGFDWLMKIYNSSITGKRVIVYEKRDTVVITRKDCYYYGCIGTIHNIDGVYYYVKIKDVEGLALEFFRGEFIPYRG